MYFRNHLKQKNTSLSQTDLFKICKILICITSQGVDLRVIAMKE